MKTHVHLPQFVAAAITLAHAGKLGDVPTPPPGSVVHRCKGRTYTRSDAVAKRKRIEKRRKLKGYA